MAKGNPNPDQSGLKSFEKGGDPRQSHNLPGSLNKWSIRNKLRHLAAQDADPEDEKALDNIITNKGERVPTVAENIAAAILKRAAKGDIKAAECAMENIEGKLPQTFVNEGDVSQLPPPVINVICPPKDK